MGYLTKKEVNKNKINELYEEMFKAYYSSLCYFAYKFVNDQDACKEIVHNVFVNIWNKKDSFAFDKSAKSYLYTSVQNRCLNYIRDSKKTKSAEEIEGFNYGIVNESHIEIAELESLIWQSIDSLPDKCRQIFILNRFEEKKYSEIADQLNISVKTVETQISRALKALRISLKNYIHILLFFFTYFLDEL